MAKKEKKNILVEQHIIKRNDSRYDEIDKAAFAAKNLYNKALYTVRQSFIHDNKYIVFEEMYHLMKGEPEYSELPAKVSQLVLKQLDSNWQGFFAAMKVWRTSPEKFNGRPNLPKYKHKTEGRFVLQYNYQAISKRSLSHGVVKPSGLNVEIETSKSNIVECRIVPRNKQYVVEIVYEPEIKVIETLNYDHVASIDMGIDNLATITSNKPGFAPVIVNGRPLKSMNQFYNKRKADLQSKLSGNRRNSNRIVRLNNKRNNKVKNYLHKSSRTIIDLLVAENIGVLVIGRNKGWKDKVNIGKVNNQKFVNIPYATLNQMLEYKAKLVGIKVIYQEESYTSKTSFLDLEPIKKQKKYAGRRIKRGLFKSSSGALINADVNGSYNILRKAFPNAFSNGIEGIVVCPTRINL